MTTILFVPDILHVIDVSEGPGDLDPLRGIEEKNGQQYVGEIKMNRWILEYQRPHPERRSGLGGSQGYSRTQWWDREGKRFTSSGAVLIR